MKRDSTDVFIQYGWSGFFTKNLSVFELFNKQGSATGRATRPGNFLPRFFRPGEKFHFESGTRPGFEIQPRNRPGPGILNLECKKTGVPEPQAQSGPKPRFSNLFFVKNNL